MILCNLKMILNANTIMSTFNAFVKIDKLLGVQLKKIRNLKTVFEPIRYLILYCTVLKLKLQYSISQFQPLLGV